MLRRGRPILRTAAIVGTASAVSGSVQHRQQKKYAEQDAAAQQQYAEPAPAPAAPAAPAMDDKLEQLKQLGELKTSGVLTDAEFEAQKAKILAG
jgi:hypothetical protein